MLRKNTPAWNVTFIGQSISALAKFLVDEGELTPEQARDHYSCEILDQCVGYGECRPETANFKVQKGDILILSTDGLYKMVPKKEEIMFVLGIQGSPRKKGNSDHLLTLFLKACESHGARTQVIHPEKLDIQPCRELIVCEKKGFCPIRDEMEEKGYSLVKEADVVVLASPIFFYNVTAQVKGFIDRCQMFWGRKYKLNLLDPDGYHRQGFLLSVGASGGKRLFEGVELTAKYFFDAISADYSGSLTYRNVEDTGDIISRPELSREIRDSVRHLLEPVLNKKILLFVSKNDACRSQMAAAFVKKSVKGRFSVLTAGVDAAAKSDPGMVKAMAEKNLDLKYRVPQSLEKVLAGMVREPDRVIFLGPEETKPELPFAIVESWEVVKPKPDSPDALRNLRDEIELRVKTRLPNLELLF